MDDNKDTYLFPPINHENLHVPSSSDLITPHSSSSSSSSSSSFDSSSFSSDSDTWTPSSSSPPFDSQLRKGPEFIGWMNMGVQILCSKLFALFSPFRNRTHRGAIWSIGMLLVSCWILMTMKRRRKKKRLTPNEARLINIIKEKDGKIAQLLHQIAQMNEILVDRHRELAAKKGGMIC
ncbi:hypothetical protein RJT34_33445 [Clitoria ternatea]|uniref:Transmembrane protein n=1 Tax=Clitoria ternatea TaxID=43366 RepID=A0AAN9EYT2_CLITE